MVEVIMPPTIGAAISFITSEPTPDAQRMGIRLERTAHWSSGQLLVTRRTTYGVIEDSLWVQNDNLWCLWQLPFRTISDPQVTQSGASPTS